MSCCVFSYCSYYSLVCACLSCWTVESGKMGKGSGKGRGKGRGKGKGRGGSDNDDDGAALVKRVSAVKKSVSPYATSFWTYFWVFAGVFLIFITQQVFRLTYDTTKKKDRVKMHKRMNHIWHAIGGKLWVDWNPFWDRVVTYEVPPEELPKPMILMANHVSFADAIFFTGAFPFDVVAVVKDDLWTTPLIGSMMKNNGALPVFFKKKNGKWTTDKKEMETMMNKAEEKLADGVSVTIAPEGTIPADGVVGEFKPGFFRLALKTNTPVLPIATWGNQKAWPMGPKDKRGYVNAQAWMYPARSYIKSGTPIHSFDGVNWESEPLAHLIEECINDSSNDLGEDDFKEAGQDTLGAKLHAASSQSETAKAVQEELLSYFIANVRAVIIEMVEELKLEYEKYEEEIEKNELEGIERVTSLIKSPI